MNVLEIGIVYLIYDLFGYEFGFFRSDFFGLVFVVFEDFFNFFEFLGSYRVFKIYVNFFGGFEGFGVERYVGDVGGVYRFGGINGGKLKEIECGFGKCVEWKVGFVGG